MRLAPLLALVAACGPMRAPPFTPPEAGGPAWTELRSPHFVLRSDMRPAVARDPAQALALQTRAVIALPDDTRDDAALALLHEYSDAYSASTTQTSSAGSSTAAP